ncbi:hypothetical protein JYB87_12745 [Shewanella avicenniae]|uniref:Uncharacterized protein n=1 Tax=Shewanella avicenniae TaxID=2814294 RepID=A0ABX7QNM1_9GAMM|nr:hypothetical protein [Shewanella avicenniae]QSX32617.1 hypothetical protein JYB87_12745 [Shewanella avicenniae]
MALQVLRWSFDLQSHSTITADGYYQLLSNHIVTLAPGGGGMEPLKPKLDDGGSGLEPQAQSMPSSIAQDAATQTNDNAFGTNGFIIVAVVVVVLAAIFWHKQR